MSFKTDWSFLEKITMGAVGTRKVMELLNEQGHRIIELERYSTSNKIWGTKIKRLRMPDLLCLHCGKRIESRAKSKLGVIMSDSDANPDRRWFSGLREDDMVAFIACYQDAHNHWAAGDAVNLFAVRDMLASEAETRLSAPKSAYEGSERDRTWKSYVPGFDFTVTEIEEDDEGSILRFEKPDGHRTSRRIPEGQYLYINRGESYRAGEKIVAGIVPAMSTCECGGPQYDFYADLYSAIPETRYAAVKALGYLPRTQKAVEALGRIAGDPDMDHRVRLEAYASLLRLGEGVWNRMTEYMRSLEASDLKMEYILILGELGALYPDPASEYLGRMITDPNATEEMVAAAVWSMPARCKTPGSILRQCFSEIPMIRNHAIAKMEKQFTSGWTADVLEQMGKDPAKNAICTHILTHAALVDKQAVVDRYIKETDETVKAWLLFVIGLSGRTEYQELLVTQDSGWRDTFAKLEVLWECHPHSMSQAQVDDIEFIKQQD